MDKALHTTHGRATQHGIPNVKQNLHTTTGQSHRGTFGGTVREGRGEVKSEGKERETMRNERNEGKRRSRAATNATPWGQGKRNQRGLSKRNPRGQGKRNPRTERAKASLYP